MWSELHSAFFANAGAESISQYLANGGEVGMAVWGAIVGAAITLYANQQARKDAKGLSGPGQEVAAQEATNIAQTNRLRQQAELWLNQARRGGPPPTFRLGTRPGEGTDIEEFMSEIQSNAEFNKLLQLIGVGQTGTGASQLGLQLGSNIRQGTNQELADIGKFLLMQSNWGSGGE